MASARLAKSAAAKQAASKDKETGQAASQASTTRLLRKRRNDDDDDVRSSPAKKARPTRKSSTPTKRQESPLVGTSGSRRINGRIEQPNASPAKEAQHVEKASVPSTTKKAVVKSATQMPKIARPKNIINSVPTQLLDVYVFGEGSSSELGLGTAKNAIDVKRPRLNPLLSSKEVGIVFLACGGMHVAALTHDNKILTWGVNDQGALGRDTTWEGGLKDIDGNESDQSEQSDSGLNPLESHPTPVPSSCFPEGTKFVQLSAGDSHTLALTDEGLVYGWGCFRKDDGVLGFLPGSDVEIQHSPVLLPQLKKITHVASGANHAMALDKKGAVFIWGSGEQNQLGYHIVQRTGTKHQKTCLQPRPLRTKVKAYKAIYAGSDHSFAIDHKDKLWSWGVNSFGACGILEGAGDDNAVVYVPSLVEHLELKDDHITHIDGGQHHTIAITKNGKALIWGRNDGYQVGLDMSTVPRDCTIRDDLDKPRIVIIPTPVPGLGKAVWASAGTDHTIVINDQGLAYAWGLSATYQTGLGTLEDVKLPTHIDNTAVRNKMLNWSGCGGQYSILTAPAVTEILTNGV